LWGQFDKAFIPFNRAWFARRVQTVRDLRKLEMNLRRAGQPRDQPLYGQRAASLFQVLRTPEDRSCQFLLTTSQFTIGRCSTLV
jgi:hypothetical protein